MATADVIETTIDTLLSAAQALATAGDTGDRRGARVTATSGREHCVLTFGGEADLLRALDAASPVSLRVDKSARTSTADSCVLVRDSPTHVLVVARIRKP